MWYEINVSKNGMHFFATHERSITTERELIKALKVFKEKFSKEEGYAVTFSECKTTGNHHNEEDVEKYLEKHV